MARKSKLRPAQIRQIYRSSETAKTLAKRHGISQQMVYLIKSGRAHAKLTKPLGQTIKTPSATDKQPAIDVNALADAIIDRLIKRLRL